MHSPNFRFSTAMAYAFCLLDTWSSSPQHEAELRELATSLKKELQEEYERVIPARSQKNMTLFELTLYSPAIEELWSETGISRLKPDGAITKKWNDIFEDVAYKLSKYSS
ncbi:hypothetical protein [Terriglobus albidus]|uniref:hypothetical protein n=1 Tax=Terriglobus albidus TaxID=1592106 RepID=UPI0021E04382|nr:hypothetical protein [Terriglobus albidus]